MGKWIDLFDTLDTFTEGCCWPENTGTAKNRQGEGMLLLLASVWQE